MECQWKFWSSEELLTKATSESWTYGHQYFNSIYMISTYLKFLETFFCSCPFGNFKDIEADCLAERPALPNCHHISNLHIPAMRSSTVTVLTLERQLFTTNNIVCQKHVNFLSWISEDRHAVSSYTTAYSWPIWVLAQSQNFKYRIFLHGSGL